MSRSLIFAAALALALGACGTAATPNRNLTTQECTSEGGRAYTDPGDGSLDSCPDGLSAIGHLSDAIEGGLCCE